MTDLRSLAKACGFVAFGALLAILAGLWLLGLIVQQYQASLGSTDELERANENAAD
jgi:hypothetical protein